MDLRTVDTALIVSDLPELTATNAPETKKQVREAIKDSHNRVDFDLSKTTFLDSSGLGVLIGLHKTMASKSGSIRIVNPSQNVQQVLELTRLHRLFEIATTEPQ